MGKCIAWTLQDEIQLAAGPLQVSSGLKGGAEAAIHAMRNIFEADSTDAVILVDASNAFNRLNRGAALHNIQYLCPPLALSLINTYRKPARLFIVGGEEITSSEGTTQGDPLSMQFYALGTSPLIQLLKSKIPNVSQVWLADDATSAGKLPHLKDWWDMVIHEGEKFGYYVNADKSWIILKNPEDLQAAEEIFKDTNINITTSGKRHLGAALGSRDFQTEYIEEKVNKWCEEIKTLADIAKTQPHAAYSAYTHGQQHKINVATNPQRLDRHNFRCGRRGGANTWLSGILSSPTKEDPVFSGGPANSATTTESYSTECFGTGLSVVVVTIN